MKLFKTKAEPVTLEDQAAAARLGRIMARRHSDEAPPPASKDFAPFEGQRRVFWTPSELPAGSLS